MPYESASRCAQQAAIIAGMKAGKHNQSHNLAYRYSCAPSGGNGDWYTIGTDRNLVGNVWKNQRDARPN